VYEPNYELPGARTGAGDLYNVGVSTGTGNLYHIGVSAGVGSL
jgi:hypothetical protein